MGTVATNDAGTTNSTTATTGVGGASGSGGASTTQGGSGAGAGASSDAGGAAGETGNQTSSTGGSSATLDVFGIQQLYPSAPSGGVWTSEHWSGGSPYGIDDRTDENDPLGISGMRGTGVLQVTGDGELVMGGSQPRLYVYPSDAGPWRDIEVTVYYRRVEDDATAYAGLVVGARSGPEGHGDTPCDAHTYYSRLRHDGATDFEKELMHAPSSTRGRVDPELVWPPDGQLPFDTWIGWKYVIYNLPGDEGIKLESYRDLSEGAAGGDWELINETTDAGGWFSETSCDEHAPVDGQSDLIYLEGGITFIRNTGLGEARYRWMSIREIAP